MSECKYFWTNFHKSLERDPVCPAGAASGYIVYNAGTLAGSDPAEYIHTIVASPSGENGLDLLDVPEGITSMALTPEWVDLGTFAPVGVAVLLSGGGGIG